MTALDQLAEKVETAAELGLLPESWAALARQARDETAGSWAPEPAFREATGSSAEWCRRNFDRYVELGLAKRVARVRYWHSHARAPRKRADDEGLVQEIAHDMRSSA